MKKRIRIACMAGCMSMMTAVVSADTIFETDRAYAGIEAFDLSDMVSTADVLWQYVSEMNAQKMVGLMGFLEDDVCEEDGSYYFTVRYPAGAYGGFVVNVQTGDVFRTESIISDCDDPAALVRKSTELEYETNLIDYYRDEDGMELPDRLIGVEKSVGEEEPVFDFEKTYKVDDSCGEVYLRSFPSHRYYNVLGRIDGDTVTFIGYNQNKEFVEVYSETYDTYGACPAALLVQDAAELGFSEGELVEMCGKYIMDKEQVSALSPNARIAVDYVEGDEVHLWYYEDYPDHSATIDRYTINSLTGKGQNIMGEEVDLTSYIY